MTYLERSINQYSKEGKFIKHFNNVYDASYELRIPKNYIHQSASKPLHTVYGYYFRYNCYYQKNKDITPKDMRVAKY